MAAMSVGRVSGDRVAAAANERVEGGIHMSRIGGVHSACMQDDSASAATAATADCGLFCPF